MLETLGNTDIFGKDFRITQELYRQQTGCIRNEMESKYTKIKKRFLTSFIQPIELGDSEEIIYQDLLLGATFLTK